jgi:hypothetical protein
MIGISHREPWEDARSMKTGEDHLAQAERHVREGAARIADLERKIVELEKDGHGALAADLLVTLKLFKETQDLALAHVQTERAERGENST